MADDLTCLLGDERHPDEPAVPKGIDEPGLIVLLKSQAVDVPGGVFVGGGFWPNDDAHDSPLHGSRCLSLSMRASARSNCRPKLV